MMNQELQSQPVKTVFRIWFILACSALSHVLIAQGTTQRHLTQQSIQFTDGLYTNIGMVQRNSPVPSTWIETDLDIHDREFFSKVTKEKQIVFYDHNGVRTIMATDSIWGYCQNGDPYINIYKDFHKIDYVGRISHFIARKSTYIDFEIKGSHPRAIYYMNLEAIVKNTGYLVDLYEDKVLLFNVANLEQVLQDDPELLNEFMTLKKRKKERMKFIFLRRYNEKYPLDSP